MIESLTPEQTAKLEEYKNHYINLFYNNPKPTDLDELTGFVEWVYKDICGLAKPKVVLVDSPIAALEMAAELIAAATGQPKKVEWVEPTYYLSGFNAWISFYDYFDRELKVIDHENFRKFKKVLELNIFWSLTFDTHCIVVRNGSYKRKGENLHCEDGPAITFPDGKFDLYAWNGVIVPKKLIMDPDNLTQKDIMSEENAEIRRCYMERLGGKKYYDLLSGGEGCTLLDEDEDKQGNMMRLYETTFDDDIIKTKVQFLECIDPSTMRMYNIYPPSQKCKTVWEAKANTFNDEKLFVRHGDVGLVNLNQSTEFPVQET